MLMAAILDVFGLNGLLVSNRYQSPSGWLFLIQAALDEHLILKKIALAAISD